MPNVRSNWPGCFCWNSFYRFYRFREIPTTLKITSGHSYVATNALTNASWPANLCEWIALAATNVFEILTLLLMPVRTQFTNPSWPPPLVLTGSNTQTLRTCQYITRASSSDCAKKASQQDRFPRIGLIVTSSQSQNREKTAASWTDTVSSQCRTQRESWWNGLWPGSLLRT